MNLFGNFSPLCGAAPVNVIKTVLGVQENKRVQQMNPDIHRRTKLLPLPVLIHTETFATNFVSFISNSHLKDPIISFVSNFVNGLIALALSSQGIKSCSPKFPHVEAKRKQKIVGTE